MGDLSRNFFSWAGVYRMNDPFMYECAAHVDRSMPNAVPEEPGWTAVTCGSACVSGQCCPECVRRRPQEVGRS